MIVYILCFGIAISQFYFFKSGIPQPAHYVIALSFISFLVSSRHITFPNNGIWPLKFLLAFVIYQACVNVAYFAISQDTGFVMQMLYILYGFIVFLFIFNLYISETGVLRKITFFSLFGLSVLFFLPFVGLGEYRFFPRYNAFFNDPNQMAFWALCVSAMCICYFCSAQKILLAAIVFVITSYIVLLSASRSGLLGLLILFIGFFVSYIRLFKRTILPMVFGFCLAFYVIYNFVSFDSDAISFLTSRIDIVDADEQAKIRGYTRIIEYPEYIVFGAGHGMDTRFDGENTEIHSTWAGVLFYYGLFGFIFFVGSLLSILQPLCLHEKFLFISPLFYSLSTFGLRTPIFWVFLAYFVCSGFKKIKKT